MLVIKSEVLVNRKEKEQAIIEDKDYELKLDTQLIGGLFKFLKDKEVFHFYKHEDANPIMYHRGVSLFVMSQPDVKEFYEISERMKNQFYELQNIDVPKELEGFITSCVEMKNLIEKES